ncbi:hypothetical protein HOLleu_28639 [Holothuria leucospilota]|uniref:Uncharacterized protein n=1 Tax=Holothuria leucospilota TaxID=206669 RepID=A0A9Q1BM59_HOLLE|nr:hypothetical protein HOLleu_28639 [Holothuria leucospilota]
MFNAINFTSHIPLPEVVCLLIPASTNTLGHPTVLGSYCQPFFWLAYNKPKPSNRDDVI